jgi:hypothetical protein
MTLVMQLQQLVLPSQVTVLSGQVLSGLGPGLVPGMTLVMQLQQLVLPSQVTVLSGQ